MKYLRWMVAILVLSGVLKIGVARTIFASGDCDSGCVQTVKSLIKENESGFISGLWEKETARLGDRVAIALRKIYVGKSIAKEKNIRAFLPVIKGAFEYPKLIEGAENQSPVETFKLLDEIKIKTSDKLLETEIKRTINFIRFKTGSVDYEVLIPKS